MTDRASLKLPWWVFLLALVAIGLLVWLGLRGGSGPVKDAGRDAHADSSGAIQRMDSNAVAAADTVLAREARRDTAEWAKDSAYAKLARHNDSVDLIVARLRRANQARRDSLNQFRLEPGAGTPDTTFLDTATVIASDTALSCEVRYRGRLEQLNLLGQALERCRARGDTVRQTLIGVRDSFALSVHYARATDSLLAWEVRRPRPCRVSLLVASVGCGTAMGGTAVIAFLGGLLAGH